MSLPDAAIRHADVVTGLQAIGLRATRKAWREVDAGRISESWRAALPSLRATVVGLQFRAAVDGSEYGALALAGQGVYVPPAAFVDPAGFVGSAPDGRPLEGLLYSPATQAKTMIGAGVAPEKAVALAGSRLETMIRSVVADAARAAASVDIATRDRVGYVRMLVGTSCPDCVILAGRLYRWNAGFKRHPGDDCIHVPSTAAIAGNATTDPLEHFAAMTEAEQDEFWGAADAQAIRDGADINRVYNARRGTAKDGMTTTEGTTKRRGYAQRGRLTPDAIYAQAGSREEAIALLRQHGYIYPEQRERGMSIVRREGFGALGRGGTRVGARQAVEQARVSGERAGSRYTMTAAEQRLHDATARWEAVRQGRNPDRSDGLRLTPEISARVERDYRRWLRTGGQIY